MFSKHDVVLHVHDIHNVFWVLVSQKLQDLQLNSGLVNVLALVFNYLQSDLSLSFVVDALKGCSEAAFS
jgi:hypothetical protein